MIGPGKAVERLKELRIVLKDAEGQIAASGPRPPICLVVVE